jgi:hypothetical protein
VAGAGAVCSSMAITDAVCQGHSRQLEGFRTCYFHNKHHCSLSLSKSDWQCLMAATAAAAMAAAPDDGVRPAGWQMWQQCRNH